MDFRIINDETLPKIMELWDYCFEKNDTPFFKWYFNEYCLKENMVLGGFDEKSGNLMNMLHLNPYTINLRGRDLKLPYIVGVATAPEYRGRHLFAPLLETAFSVLRAQGQAFVLLMPISAGIYRPYQFDYCYYRHRYEMPLAALPKGDKVSDMTLHRTGLEKAEVFQKVYDTVTAAYHGVVKRDLKNWLHLLQFIRVNRLKRCLLNAAKKLLAICFTVLMIIHLLCRNLWQKKQRRVILCCSLPDSMLLKLKISAGWQKSGIKRICIYRIRNMLAVCSRL